MTTLRPSADFAWTEQRGASGDVVEEELLTPEKRRAAKRRRVGMAPLIAILILGPLLAGAVVIAYGVIRFKWLG